MAKQSNAPASQASEKTEPETPKTATADPDEGDVKQAVVTGGTFKRLKVPGLTGAFSSAVFGNDNVTVDPVDEEVQQKVFMTFGDKAQVVD